MWFLSDERGQSVVIGSVILFGFLIVALSLYQAQVVPAENSQVEFEHSQDVDEQFLTLRNTVGAVATTGGARSTAIPLGTRYPQRTFSINPPPATGRLTTTAARSVTIDATVTATAHPNVQDFWATAAPTFETKSLQYTPQYNELRAPGSRTYEHSYVTTSVSDAVVVRSSQTLVRDNRLSLPLLTGNLSETGVQPVGVDITPLSSQQRTIPITGDGGPIELRLPTAVRNATALAERLTISEAETITAAGDTLVITFPEAGTYRLGLGAVSVGDDAQPASAYLVPVGGEDVLVNQSVGVEVRDKYNNPVAGPAVTIDGDTFTTNTDGQVFTTPTETGELVAQLNPTPASYEEVVFEVRSAGADGSTGSDSVVGPNITVVSGDRDITVQAGATIALGDRGSGATTALAGSIDTVGTVDRVRSGTPIQALQYDVVGPDGTEFITDAQYAQFDTDVSQRQSTFDSVTGITAETLIDTSEWPTGTNTLRLRAQDASGRVTPGGEIAVVNVTVEEGSQTPTRYPTSVSADPGTLTNPGNLQAPDGQIAIFDGEDQDRGPTLAFDVTTVTENVAAGDYTLEVDVTAGTFQGGGVDVTVSDADGAIGSGTISSTGVFTLDLDPSVAGDITVRYEARNQNTRLEIDFQRLT